MNAFYRYLLLLPLFPAVVSCKIYDDMDTIQEPAYHVVQNTYGGGVCDIFKVAELSDFFQSYQKIRSDRDASMQLAETYFPEGAVSEDGLYYEFASVSSWGRIFLKDDGSFRAVPGGFSRYYYSYWPEIVSYHVTSDRDRHFIIEMESSPASESDCSLRAVVSCGDKWVTIEDCRISHKAGSVDGYTISSVQDSNVRKEIVSSSGYVYQAASGQFSYVYNVDTGKSDEFVLEFHDDHVSICRDGKTVNCKPLDENHVWQVDYVID